VSVSSKSCKYIQQMARRGKGYLQWVCKKHNLLKRRMQAGMGTCHIHAAESALRNRTEAVVEVEEGNDTTITWR